MKFGYQGGFSNPTQTYNYFNEVIHVRMQQRRAEPAHAGHRRTTAGQRQVRPQPHARRHFYAQDQWTRNRLTLQGGVRYDHLRHQLSRLERSAARAIRLAADRDRVSRAVDAAGQLERRHAARGRGLRPVRERQDGRQVQPRQVHGSRRGDQQRPRPESADPHRRSARRGRGPTRTRISCRTAISRTPRRTANARPWTIRTSGKRCSPGPTTPTSSPAGATVRTTGGWASRSSRKSCRASR